MSFYDELPKYLGLTTVGLFLFGVSYIIYKGYKEDKTIAKSEQRAKSSGLEKTVNKK